MQATRSSSSTKWSRNACQVSVVTLAELPALETIHGLIETVTVYLEPESIKLGLEGALMV